MKARISELISKLRNPKANDDERSFLGYGREEVKPPTIHWVTARDVKTQELLQSVPCLSTTLADQEKGGFEKMRAGGHEGLRNCVIQVEPLACGRKPPLRRAA